MKTVLVTGATGCIGSNLITQLLRRGCTVRAFHRKDSNLITLEHLDFEHRTGDIRDATAMRSAMEGCDTVFHTAAIVSFWKRKRDEQLDVNINGTRTVVEACIACGVTKLVHTSSIVALGYMRDEDMIDETTEFNWDRRITYKYSKHRAEIEVLNGAARGLDATIVNPTVVIGPRDAHMHGGQLVRDMARKRVPVYFTGGMNVVSVHDVVGGHLAAADKGRSGERYILGGVQFTYKEIFSLVAHVLNVPKPRIKAPTWSIRTFAKLCDIFGEITDTEPWINSQLISGLGMHNRYSSDKAKRELGYTISALEPVIRETFEWYREHGMV